MGDGTTAAAGGCECVWECVWKGECGRVSVGEWGCELRGKEGLKIERSYLVMFVNCKYSSVNR